MKCTSKYGIGLKIFKIERGELIESEKRYMIAQYGVNGQNVDTHLYLYTPYLRGRMFPSVHVNVLIKSRTLLTAGSQNQ